MKGARSFGWFLLAGLLGLFVDVAVLYLAAPLLGWYAARVLSFLAAATVTWRINRRYTFADAAPRASLLREYLAYLSAMLGGAAINYTVYVLVLHWLDGPWAAAIGVTLGSAAGLIVNFSAARYLVFKAGPRG